MLFFTTQACYSHRIYNHFSPEENLRKSRSHLIFQDRTSDWRGEEERFLRFFFFSINYFDRIYEHCWHIECREEMTSPGCVIVAHTRTFNEVYSVIGTSRKYTDFEPPKKIGKQTERERESFMFTQNAQVLTGEKTKRRRRRRKRRRSNSSIVVDEKNWRE